MIEERDGDIFKQDDLDIIAHQANCMCTMGSGIAKLIREKFPEAYAADCKTIQGDLTKLGTYSHALVNDNDLMIVNLYGQGNFTNRKIGKRDTRYDALHDSLELLRNNLHQEIPDGQKIVLGIPDGIGCKLGGGNWEVVRIMIDIIFRNSTKIDVVICKLK